MSTNPVSSKTVSRKPSRLEVLAPYLAFAVGVVSFLIAVIAHFLYEAPCSTACSGRSWQLNLQQYIAFAALIPAGAVVIALFGKKPLLLKTSIPIMTILYIVWITVIIDQSG